MKIVSKTVLLILLLAGSAYAQAEPENYFDFWVGEWEVSWDEREGRVGKGINTIEKILDDTVIRENFRILEGQNAGFKGTSISVYHKRAETWRQAWADNQGGYFDFKGSVEGDKRIFQTAEREREDGTKMTQRMVFYDITKDTFTWDWEASNDGGDTWTLNWRINYKRME